MKHFEMNVKLSKLMKVKYIYALVVTLIINGCFFKNDKFIRKNINDAEINIKWYYYSYISNTSPDFIDVSSGDASVCIYESEDVVTDVYIENKNIVVKLYKPERGIIYTDTVLSSVFGYNIIFDDKATYKDYRNTPDGIKE